MAYEIKCPKCGEVFTVDEAGYAAIVKQVRDSEFKKDLQERKKEWEKQQKGALELAKAELAKNYEKMLNDKELYLQNIKNQLAGLEQEHQLALSRAVAERDQQLITLKADMETLKKDQELLIGKAVAESQEEIVRLQGQLSTNEEIAKNKEQSLIESYKNQLQDRDAEIQRIKDMKFQMSTKMVGETLEQHCEIEFNKLRATGFETADFGKDNDDKSGSKGDYIFRDYDGEGNEYISIMFEMKNEMEETEKKHKNEDFFKKLDKDRKEKNCEYAVLVTMLEKDNEFYNNGIVDVSYKYDKMYVIRPQFFIPMITTLRNAARKSLDYKKQLVALQQQNVDVANFEKQMEEFKVAFGKNYRVAGDHFKKAIDQIDASIAALEKTKAELIGSEKQLRLANDKAQDLSVKKLTKDSPLLRQQFQMVREATKVDGDK